ncbi:MAG: hypothetical protein Q9M91_01855 [Candidatus Dojkabacteria bacterium]|nr:hypothetical protein [Candidatus Dojkabacteria bacterium]
MGEMPGGESSDVYEDINDDHSPNRKVRDEINASGTSEGPNQTPKNFTIYHTRLGII